MGQIPEALAQAQKAVDTLETLRQTEPANSETLVVLLQSYDLTAEIEKGRNNFNSAATEYLKAVAVLESVTQSQSDNIQWRRMLASESANVARVHEAAAVQPKTSREKRLSELRAAKEWYQRSLSLWQQLNDVHNSTPADVEKLAEVTRAIARIHAFEES